MKKINLNFALMLSLFIGLSSASQLNAQTHIKTAADLDNIRNDASASYILDNHIDMADFAWVAFDFSGTLDGNGYYIMNLTVDVPGPGGMFIALNGATIQNVHLKDLFVYGGDWAGGLARQATGSTITKSSITGEVESTGLCGGFLAHASNTTISESYTIMDVTGHDHVGGLVGHMEASSLTDSYTNSNVVSTGWQVGGLVGWAQNADVVITRSFALGTVLSDGGFTGGILGIADGADKVVGITDCMALQTSIGTTNPDIAKTYRIIGAENAGTFSNNYALADIAISDPFKVAWESDKDGKDGSDITLDNVKTALFYADSLATWDFVGVWALGTDYPYLLMEESIQVIPDIVHITDAAGLAAIVDDPNDTYILDNDIDMDGVSWTPFDFSGILEGNGYSIMNLTVDVAGEAGMFLGLNGATIQNLNLTDIFIYGSNWAGGIARAANGATIYRCTVTGDVESGSLCGGLLAHAVNTTVSESFTKVDVKGHDHVGGLIGHMEAGSLTDSYTYSNVESTGWQVGGLVGWAQNANVVISRSYAMGTVLSDGGFTGGIIGIADGGDKVVDITDCMALQTSISTTNPDIEKTYRIIGAENAGTFSNNYALADIALSDPFKVAWESDKDGKDGSDITLDDVKNAQFYIDSLSSWDFTDVWELRNDIPRLQWEPADVVDKIEKSSINDNIKIFAYDGLIQVVGASVNDQLVIYDLSGRIKLTTTINSTHENYDVEGFSIVVIRSSEGTSAFKIANFRN